MKPAGPREVVRHPEGPGAELVTERGRVRCRLHAAGGERAVLWVFGSGGGLGGPAGGVYARLARRLQPEGVSSLEVDYRRPGALADCVEDVLAGLAWLGELGQRRVALVGHSFGGAVVIEAGARSGSVVAVAALSSQTAGTEAVGRLSPRPLLLAPGEDDEVLPADCSRHLHARAREPKELILYPGCRHGLDECRDALDRDLVEWLGAVLPRGHAGP